ncbi:MAG: SapC family protein [Kangiellaceae bacterium]|nr:SapC family protein [Kangiellaceae bacterium]MCW9018182.1 SapC family protein [Kangiellaceae bacterium]
MTTIVQLNKEQHQNLRLVEKPELSLVQDKNMVPVLAQEIPQLATELPLVFVKNAQTGEFTLVAMLGLQERQNLMIQDDKWLGGTLPSCLTHSPLGLSINAADKTQFAVTINTISENISESEGHSLFSEDGTESDYLKKRIEVLKNYYQCGESTYQFTKLIVDLELLEQQTLSYELKGQKQSVSGIYLVNEKKLNDLENEKFIELRNNGALSAIYGHLVSLKTIDKLVKRLK